MSEVIRTFIAIELPDNVREELAELEERLAATGADVKWVQPRNIHLTVKFLGDIGISDLDNVKNALQNSVSLSKEFITHLSQVGAFPKLNFPRIIWTGIDKGKDEIMEIFTALEQNLSEAGFQKDVRPLSPHLTIGRVRSPKNKEVLIKKLENMKYFSKYEISVDGVSLFKSTLTQNDPIYERIFKADFLH